MPRKPLIRTREHYYHITARSNNKEDFYLPKDRLWLQFLFLLRSLQIEYDLKIGAFVLMDNHFHLLMMSPQEDIDRVMYFLMKKLSLFIRRDSKRVNRVFGGRYKGFLIMEETYLFNVYKYIYRHPVKAGLCARVEDYAYSSWHQSKVETKLLFFPEKRTSAELSWLNCDFEKSQSEGLKRSLKKSIFQIPLEWKPESIIFSPF